MEKWPSDDTPGTPRPGRRAEPLPVLTRWQLLDDAQIEANGTIEIHDDAVLGKVRQPRPAARFDRTPAAVGAMAPFLGADNRAILGELGYSQAEIAHLAEDGVLAFRGPVTDR